MNFRTLTGIILGLIFFVLLYVKQSHIAEYIIVGGLLFLLPAAILIWSGIRRGISSYNESSVYKLFEAISQGNIDDIKLQLGGKTDTGAKYGIIHLFFKNKSVLANHDQMRLIKTHNLKKILKTDPLTGQRVPCPVSMETAPEFARTLLKEADKPALYEEILELLYANGYARPYGYLTDALCEAIGKNDLAAVEALLKRKADMEAKNSSGDSPIHIAVKNGYIDMVKMLAGFGADLNNKTRFWSEKRWEETVEITDSDFNGQGHYNIVKGGEQTPLMLAVLSNHAELVKFLLENGANPNEVDANRNTAIMIAKESHSEKLVDLLQMRNK